MAKSSTSIKIHFRNGRPMVWRHLSNNNAWTARRFKKLVEKYAKHGATTIKVEVYRHPNENAAYKWAMSQGKSRLTKQYLEWRVESGISELFV